MNKSLEDKRDSLSEKLFKLKEDYVKIISSNMDDTDVIKHSLINQIDLLTELIHTIKISINLFQQAETVK